MNPTLEILTAYFARVGPGLLLFAMMLYLARRQPRLRIVLYLALFILIRDAMTPLGLWFFGVEGFFWIRLHSDPVFLVASGVTSLGICLAIYYLDRDNQSLVRWTRGSLATGLLWGLGGMVVVVAPVVALYLFTPIESRGGPVPLGNVPAILVFTL